MTLTTLTLLAACSRPDVPVQVPTDTGISTPTDPIEKVVLVAQDSQEFSESASLLQGGDVDGDGLSDVGLVLDNSVLAWAQSTAEGIETPRNLLPDGLLATLIEEAMDSSGSSETTVFVQGLQLVDLDGDGRSEWLVTATVEIDTVYRLLTVLLSDPMGQVSLEVVGPGEYLTQAVSDLDGDGLPELVLFGDESAVYTSGDSVWPLGDAVDWNYYPQVAAMDLDGSGGRDLVVFLNGGFGISEIHPFYQENDALSPGLVNQDLFANEAKITAASDGEQEALLLTGTQVLRLNQEGLFEEVGGANAFYVGVEGDLDGDQKLDLIQLTSPQPVLYASGPEGPLTLVSFEGPKTPLDTALVLDLDGDGRQDLVGIRWDSENSTSLLESWLNASGE